MAVFHFPQYEQELFYRYWDRLHAYLAQCASCGYSYGKWEILHVVDEGVTCETRALFEYWDFYARTVDEAWDFLDWLAQDTYDFETSCVNSCNPLPCIPDLAPSFCETCHCSDHASTSCPYYISDEGFTRLSSMLETIDEQHIRIFNSLREYDLSRETDLRFSSTRLDVTFCDDGESVPPLESGLEEVPDPPPTTLSFVAPSSFSVSADEDDLCYELGDVFTQVPDCHATPLGSSYVDVVVAESTGPDVIASVSPDHVDMPHVSPPPSLPSPSLECCSLIGTDYHDVLKGKVSDCIESLGTLEGYDPPFDPCHDYLVDMPREIIWAPLFDHSSDFSTAYNTIMRTLTLPAVSFPVFSYVHHSRMHAGVYDGLLRALTASAWYAWILALKEWLMLLQPLLVSS